MSNAKKSFKRMSQDLTSVVEHLPRMYEVLGSVLSTDIYVKKEWSKIKATIC